MKKRFNLTRLYIAVLLTMSSIVLGVLGFMGSADYGFVDALYMTAITISTVGYGTVGELGTSGKLFVAFYVLLNLGVAGYVVSVLTQYIFDGELRRMFKMYRTNQEISKFTGHVIVCGFGRNGSKAFHELRQGGTECVVVEQDENLLRIEVQNSGGGRVAAIFGDATDEAVLRQAGVLRARALITALPKDADNVFVALTAREMNPKLKIIARASSRSSVSKLHSAGADSVVMPDEIGGSHMANLVIRPEVIRFLDMISGLDPEKLRLEEMPVVEMRPALQGQSIRELDIRSRVGATVIALRLHHGELVVSPAADVRPAPGDVLLLLGTEAQIARLVEYYKR
ncbi:potassium channel protein [Hymenobacter saemangeumensis]|uniref:Potassium channel protein n=1 Tax=Hymenobacter saemangeumensis TaxID=1084522 RepID=A0ABP8IN33_9BACT